MNELIKKLGRDYSRINIMLSRITENMCLINGKINDLKNIKDDEEYDMALIEIKDLINLSLIDLSGKLLGIKNNLDECMGDMLKQEKLIAQIRELTDKFNDISL